MGGCLSSESEHGNLGPRDQMTSVSGGSSSGAPHLVFRKASPFSSPKVTETVIRDDPPVFSLPDEGELKEFTYQELHRCTKSFAANNVLGEGGFGKVYKGRFKAKSGNLVLAAVKVLSPKATQGMQELVMEVKVLCRLVHPNLVRLYGFSRDKTLCLVYEYVALRSLDFHLFGKDPNAKTLTWEQRLIIALGSARGLSYLHENNVIHRDFKAANILLTENYETKLADFGLAKDIGGQTHVSTAIMGTMGYLDPTYASTGQLTKKSDVYAYGVVLLELLTGKKAMGLNGQGKPISLASWAKPYIDDRKANIQVICDTKLVEPFPTQVAKVLATSARYCLFLEPRNRPDVDVLVQHLTNLTEKFCGRRDGSSSSS